MEEEDEEEDEEAFREDFRLIRVRSLNAGKVTAVRSFGMAQEVLQQFVYMGPLGIYMQPRVLCSNAERI